MIRQALQNGHTFPMNAMMRVIRSISGEGTLGEFESCSICESPVPIRIPQLRLDAIPSIRLRGVERLGGFFHDERRDFLGVWHQAEQSDADGDEGDTGREAVWDRECFDLFADLIGDCPGAVGVGFREQHTELVFAESCDDIAGPVDLLFEKFCDFPDAFGGFFAGISVREGFEVVDTDHGERQWAFSAERAFPLLVQALVEETLGAQAGEIVLHVLFGDLIAHLFDL